MGCVLAGSYRSQRRTPRRAMTVRLRLLTVADRAVMLFTNRRRPVELSDHAQVLSALRGLHVAAGSTNREAVPVPRGFLQPAALTLGQETRPSQAAAIATPRLLAVDRALSERDASSVTRATPTSGARALP